MGHQTLELNKKTVHKDRTIKGSRADLSGKVLFVYLKGSKAVIGERIASRKGHFMPASLLDSQFATLEEPSGGENYIDVDATQNISDMIQLIMNKIQKLQ